MKHDLLCRGAAVLSGSLFELCQPRAQLDSASMGHACKKNSPLARSYFSLFALDGPRRNHESQLSNLPDLRPATLAYSILFDRKPSKVHKNSQKVHKPEEWVTEFVAHSATAPHSSAHAALIDLSLACGGSAYGMPASGREHGFWAFRLNPHPFHNLVLASTSLQNSVPPQPRTQLSLQNRANFSPLNFKRPANTIPLLQPPRCGFDTALPRCRVYWGCASSSCRSARYRFWP